MSSPVIPSFEQLASARLAQWHQNGEALLTFENLRSWMNVAGLVLFTPRPAQLPAPAPSLVEAVLGAPSPEPTLADTEQARTLLARLISEGIAVPLNLLGTPGETPDFVVSAPVFSYIFTLRGDKAWKQAPATSGAVKVSPLAAATHEILTKRPALSAYDLTTQLGKEVTESAVLRSLNELWAHLRVIPVPQPDGQATLWELTSARFTKHIKAGANAGQPSALSALISLYLGSAMLASEEEIETFLSPLAARSRIRDVVHALMGAREIETLALDGRTVLHVSGSLPAFAAPEDLEIDVHAKPLGEIEVEGATPNLQETDAPRIKKFVAKPRKLGTGFPSDYGRKFSGAPLGENDRPARAPRSPKPDGERRPFARSAKPFGSKPAFNKPWDEDKAARPRAPRADGDSAAPAADGTFTPRPRRTSSDRPAFGSKPAFGRKPAFGTRAGSSDRPRPSFGDKPRFTPRTGDDARPPRREFTPRPEGAEGDSRPPRKTFSKPGTFGRKREGGFESRPPRRDFNAGPSDRPSRPARTFDSGDRPARPSRSFDSGDRPSRPARSFDGSDRPARPSAPRTPGSFSARPRSASGTGFGSKPSFSRPRDNDRDSSAGSGDRPARPTYRKFDAPRDRPSGPRSTGDRPARPFSKPREEGGSDRPARSSSFSGEKKPYTKSTSTFGAKKPGSFGPKKPGSFSAKPPGTFAKFADGNNPFRKPGKPGGKAKSFKGKATEKPRRPRSGE
ncbi:hypothetical protein HDF16_001348 [Granulicella aggregans]|uniref:Uncharacterized protein n=1 Tax=Granulicella aggregans TaxID=474949 RepID=A0A7W7ZB84_9BACT|nr:hypothetical protein [Granulicella aggregans]MBB5056663.1 hypothetical protein [Granulicella aggregans]